ncbi:MAG: class I SAM-dependent methyltransferase [Elusimicrobiota bacterium]
MENNPRSIKYYVKRYLLKHQDVFKDKKVIDIPCGNGVTTGILKEIGADPVPIDLFPEYFKIQGMACIKADMTEELPIENASIDYIISQEGLEHISDQAKVFKEFNRVLKNKGELLITTPNFSNLQSRLYHFLSESEKTLSFMPPNEIDSIWMTNENENRDIYFGHIFLIGVQKLRLLAKLAGFKIKSVEKTKLKTTSLLLFIILYPLILLINFITYRRNLKKYKSLDPKKTFHEIFKLSVNPGILLGSHLFIIFQKEKSVSEAESSLKKIHKTFATT